MITLLVSGTAEELTVDVRAIAIAGYTGRDQASVQKHVDELRMQGIPAPKMTPVLFSATAALLTQEDAIDVVGGSTSGEVEFVLVLDRNGEIFVTVGSDHTDRQLERTDMPASKQVVPKVIGREAWRLADIERGWDQIEMRSWIAGSPAPYQESLVSALMPPRDILRFAASRAPGPMRNVVIFSGTVPLATPGFVSADRFRAELLDPTSGQRLSIDYAVRPLG